MAENPILNERYRLIEQIGSGGMSVIYKAQDLELGRLVAVKVLRPSLVGDPEFLIRFKREAQAAANLSHPNIVTVHDVGQDGPKTHYIVMEYVTGQDLKRLIRSRGVFEVDAALAIVIEVCKGVGYAHRAGLVHCDVKPQNILVTPDNSIKVTDFGIARALSSQPSEAEDMVWGSPHYFSPEQAAGEPPTPASDVYSIGIVLFELLTDHLPFTGQDYRDLALAHLKAQPPSILDLNPALPGELDRVIRKVLSKEPSARYRTADQLGRILEKYRQQGQQPTTSFVVKPSAVSPPLDFSGETPPSLYSEPAYDTLPQPEIGRQYAYATEYVPSQPESYAYQEPYDDYGQDFVPGVDIYGLVLGVLAAVAVLGLIPVWIMVFVTLTRGL
ncbi:MAG: serine/threonine protein kinase [Anaerolineae bacterium]|nr:serine/threonine protein kinase [Anaerolineae bacterium]